MADTSIIGRVRRAVLESLPSGKPGAQDVARVLAVSPRTLQRKLQEEGTTFQTVLDAVRKVTDNPLDVPLMIETPDRYSAEVANAGADIITVHQEAVAHLHRSVELIKSLGKRAGVSLNPATPVESLDVILDELDLVLIMSVNPGFGGQAFIPTALDKIRALRQRITQRGLAAELQVDGGVKLDNIRDVVAAGADVLVAGSAVFNTDDYAATITALRERALSTAV